MKARAALAITRGPDFPSMRADDGATDGEAKPHSLLFRGEEALEYMFAFPVRNAAAMIGDGHPRGAVLRFRRNEQLALRRIAICHRFASIQHQVKQYLLKLDPVAGD